MPQNPINPKKDQLSDQIDSPHDREELEKPAVEVEIPDVHEIPGQENFDPAPLGELADTTISSADEEGDDIFNEDIDKEIKEGEDSNVTEQEKYDLMRTANDMPGDDDENLRNAALDNTDNDGTPLNEESFKYNTTASDLDIPGAELDDANEEIGEEDEENNDYSLGAGHGLGADNDIIPEDDF
ncbi:MAG TPA: hypothetical protein VN722_05145 [Hanamia sp.]|jgi:hypothetical protein|nr:hypothetical protein [Hanamia sp.]